MFFRNLYNCSIVDLCIEDDRCLSHRNRSVGFTAVFFCYCIICSILLNLLHLVITSFILSINIRNPLEE